MQELADRHLLIPVSIELLAKELRQYEVTRPGFLDDALQFLTGHGLCPAAIRAYVLAANVSTFDLRLPLTIASTRRPQKSRAARFSWS